MLDLKYVSADHPAKWAARQVRRRASSTPGRVSDWGLAAIVLAVNERGRLLALLECYDNAIQELYILDDHALLDLILRLERHRRDAEQQLVALQPSRRLPQVGPQISGVPA